MADQTIRGRLLPEAEGPKLRYYEENKYVDLSYVDIEFDPFPTPEEAQVWFQLGDEKRPAYVPLRIVNQEARTVKAGLVGERGGEIWVIFPPTNFGHTRFYAGIDELQVLADQANGGGH